MTNLLAGLALGRTLGALAQPTQVPQNFIVSNEPAICPVCGSSLAPAGRLGLSYRGLRWYFCGMDCRLAFKRKPELWAQKRPEAGQSVQPGLGAPPRTRSASPFKVR